jgi:hypothetical protein
MMAGMFQGILAALKSGRSGRLTGLHWRPPEFDKEFPPFFAEDNN